MGNGARPCPPSAPIPNRPHRCDVSNWRYFRNGTRSAVTRTISVHDAQRQFRRLTDETEHEAVVITRGDGTSVKLVPLSKQRPPPPFEGAEGEIRMRKDFDAPLDDLEGYRPL